MIFCHLSTVPLNILLSYDASSSEEEKIDSSPETVRQVLARMPPVHKIREKTSPPIKRSHRNRTRASSGDDGGRKVTEKMPPKLSIYTQLEEMKRLLKASGLKINVHELLKGKQMDFIQEICSTIQSHSTKFCKT